MSKKTFKSQASSNRTFSGIPSLGGLGFGLPATSTFGQGPNSVLSYVYEPLDLSDVSDPAIIVSFKNLQKKDGITKLRALEDLHAHIDAQTDNKQSLDDVFLRIWTSLFPRTSIDNSCRVRQSSYTLHGKIATLSGKGFVKYMPSTIGAWLAGTFDRDRQVSRAARASIGSTFPTEEKRKAVWKAFQKPIFTYCLDAVQNESIQTLSDERNSSPDDAQSKYSRAIGGALLTITGLLDTLSTQDLQKHMESYELCLKSEAVWKFAASKDSGLRKAVYILAKSAVETLPDLIDVPMLGAILITQFSADQKDSAYELLRTISCFTQLEPRIWSASSVMKAKKSPAFNLMTFLGRGSYDSGAEFYSELTILLNHIPLEILTADTASLDSTSSKMIAALRDGIIGTVSSRRQSDEQTTAAWQCMLSLTDRIVTAVSSKPRKSIIINDALFTIIRYYVDPSLVDWGRNFPTQMSIVRNAFQIAWKCCPESTTNEVEGISKAIVERMQISLPEQSKDFKKSQEAVTATFKRWYDLQADLLKDQPELAEIFMTTAKVEIEATRNILKSRNGKPYSAANALELLITKVPQTSLQSAQANDILQKLAREIIPQLMQSNSAPILIRLVDILASKQDTKDIFDTAIAELLVAPRSPTRSTALQSLAISHWPSSRSQSKQLVKAILEDLTDAMKNGSSTWSLPLVALAIRDGPPADLDDQILSTMLSGLSIDNEIESTLHGFHLLANQNDPALQEFVSSPKGSKLLSTLLYLSHHGPESVQLQSGKLKDAIKGMISGEHVNPIASIIRNNILNTSETTLSITTLWLQAEEYLADGLSEDLAKTVGYLIPDPDSWEASLRPFLRQDIDPSIALIDSLGGAVYFTTLSAETYPINLLEYDGEGYSAPLRAAIFMSRLLNKISQLSLDINVVPQLYTQILLVDLIANDNLGLKYKLPIFQSSMDLDEADLIDIAAELRQATNRWTSNLSQSSNLYLSEALRNLLKSAQDQDCSAYHHARAYILSTEGLEESQNLLGDFDLDPAALTRIRNSCQSFADLAKLVKSSNIKQNLKLFNELVSQLTTAKDNQDNKAFHNIISMNILLRDDKIELEDIPKQRLVYFVKTVVTLLEKEDLNGLRAELLKALAAIIPTLADIYDEFWESILRQAVLTITSTGHVDLNIAHAVLQMYAAIEKILKADPNEDLQEAWTKLEPNILKSRLTFLKTQAQISNTHNQPLRIVYEMLYRQLSVIPGTLQVPVQDLYPVMQSESTILHRTAYRILETNIVASQEQISLDAALSNEYVPKISPDLLSLLQESPHEDDTIDLRSRPELPASLSRYLLGWKLVLSSWDHASYKVQAAYVASLKESSSIDKFLTLCFTSLINLYGGKNKSGFDPTRLPNITTYELDNAENPEIEYLWLLSNIYYLLLLHAPQLAKSWHTNSCPRALKPHVETWTSKHMSPLIIAAELQTVSEWKPPNEDPNSTLTLKISPKASEITASLPLDETSISIKIHLPPSYPLTPINLSTDQRVGIDERKWQAFLNVSLIVMNFSSTSQGLGAVIDGISAWRKNVLGALKGHNECAICYSVVAEDGKVPNKKCATCGHMFHGLCLYKWFQRSAGSSCPLCRNAFNYA